MNMEKMSKLEKDHKALELRRLDVMQFSIWNAVESGDQRFHRYLS